ncbi:hypothetical protein [Pseudalkalibacillus salsuginis]|uniref:hypothetical protein n=1 Tax=Pseudalkalibacillus salsuginis TaxID=2910972 RepID=UPI001F20FECD|nr:hypothetical protein [Pseudalkalibacillus salsuginis]MCF6411967.1 hypothetical protein [Pseudalkalibacillus salsuginis]
MRRKKFWILLFNCLITAIILTACSSEEGNSTSNKEANNGSQIADGKVKSSLEDFQNKVDTLIEKYDDDFKKFTKSAEQKAEDLNNEDVQALKNEASQSSEKLAEELRNLEIPSELEAYSNDLKESLNDFADRFEARSEQLDNEDIEEALDKTKGVSEIVLSEFKGAVGTIYESLGIDKPEFIKETE